MNIKPLTEEVLSEWKKGLFVWVPIISLFLIILTWAITLGVTYTGREVPSKEQLKAELATEIQARSLKNIDEQLAKINDRLTKVEQAVSLFSQPAAKPSAQQGKKPSSVQPPPVAKPTP
jgi:Tfp pilus assembly protein PilO